MEMKSMKRSQQRMCENRRKKMKLEKHVESGRLTIWGSQENCHEKFLHQKVALFTFTILEK